MREKNIFRKRALCRSIPLMLVAGIAGHSHAQKYELEEVIVSGEIVYRDRTDAVSPELQYDLDFFQQFEPTSVGDMLKRTPGVTFGSDIGEYDAPQMRGLGAGYTQVLINGRPVPGASADRAVFVDRIPAEMVERIEIVRSPSADQDSQGVGGTINIVLKDGTSLDGGSLRAGLLYTDGEVRGTTGLAYGGQSNDMDWSIAANWQERYIPKVKFEREISTDGEELYFEREDDVRDSDDISLSGTMGFQVTPSSRLGFSANYISTAREENQVEQEHEIIAGERIPDTVVWEDNEIDETTTNLGATYEIDLNADTYWESSLSGSVLDRREDIGIFEADSIDEVRDERVGIEYLDIEDEELRFTTAITHVFSSGIEVKTGLATSRKTRHETLDESEVEDGIVEPDLFQTYDAEESRADAYVMGEFQLGSVAVLELGVRVENSERTIENETTSVDASNTHVNPSAHLNYDFGENTTIRASIARTIRRPGFVELSPTIQFDEPEDGDRVQGNPNLEDEVSWGLDAGFEQTIMKTGIFGVNVFYRDVTDVIEQVGIGTTDEGGVLFSFRNAGDGEVWGIEFDLSAPLADSTGLFANATFMDSKIIDPFTGEERRFMNQANYVYNVGITQTIPAFDASVGFSYQKQGESEAVEIDRTRGLSYDANLELFAEKRFGEDYVLRLTVNNALDAKKYENFTYVGGDTAAEMLANHQAGNVAYYETEVEEAEPIYMLTLRRTF